MDGPARRRRALLAVALLLAGALGVAAAVAIRARHGATAAAGATPAVVLLHARLVDGTGRPPLEDAAVVLQGDRIAAVGPAGTVVLPAGARVLELSSATLLPGLVNAHVHEAYDPEQLQRWAQAGVTTVRDESPRDPGGFLSRRDALNADPRNATIVAATPILTVTGGYGWAYADTPEEARRLVGGFAARGVDVVKTSLEDDLQGRTWRLPSREVFAALVEAAHAAGRRVSVHVSHARLVPWAVDAGADDLAHMAVEPLDDAVIARAVERGVVWIPTLELWRCVSEKHGLAWDRQAEGNLLRFRRAGGIVALGTDFAGYDCAFDRGFPEKEVAAMAAAGLTPMEVVLAATRDAARACGREAELGTVEAGKRADLLAVWGDPLADPRALAKTLLVVHRGVVIRDERPAR